MKLILSATLALFSWAASTTTNHETTLEVSFEEAGELNSEADVLYQGNKIGKVIEVQAVEGRGSVAKLKLNSKPEVDEDSILIAVTTGSNSDSNSCALHLVQVKGEEDSSGAGSENIQGFPSFSAFLNAQ